MKKINATKLKWEQWKSPKGKFAQAYKNLSYPLGDVRGGWPKQGHPFNLELIRIPPGKVSCPFHYHTHQWEFYLIVSGTGVARCGRKRHKVKAGDAFMHPPFEAHQLINTGRKPLEFYLIADNPPAEAWYYPDSKKWGFSHSRKYFRGTEVDYYDGEE